MLVSAIMPTKGRRELARKALECFLAQTWPDKELIILDDVDDLSFPSGFFPENQCPSVHYYASSRPMTIAEKRNECCERARGSILCHLDSDDYSAPERIADQVQRLEESGMAVVGYHSMLFYHVEHSVAVKYVGRPDYALGTSLMFRREWWEAHPFWSSDSMPEDNAFVKVAKDNLISVDAGQLMVARIHAGNTSPKQITKNEYRAVPIDALPEGFPR